MPKQRSKILLVDDEDEIRELLELLIADHFDIEIIQAKSGNAAIKVFSQDGLKIDLVLSDFNMKDGNGKVLHQFVRSNHPQMPFILMTSDLREEHLDLTEGPLQGYVQKPFFGESLFAELGRHLPASAVIGSSNVAEVKQYLPISISVLLKIGLIPAPLYHKVNDTVVNEVFKSNHNINALELDYYIRQGLKHLFVLQSDYLKVVGDYTKKVLSHVVIEEMRHRPKEAISFSKNVQEIVGGAVRSFGWNKDIVELGDKSIALVHATVKAVPKLHDILDWFNEEEHEDDLIYSVLLVYFLAGLYKDYKFKNAQAFDILSYAAFFCDISLDSHYIKNQYKFVNAIRIKSSANKQELDVIKSHPNASAEKIKTWDTAPQELITVIKQHHEAADGSGFPKGLSGGELTELSSAFIVAYELVEIYMMTKDKLSLRSELKKKQNLFNSDPAKVFFELAINHL